MKLTIYDIIKRPVISSKAYQLNKRYNQLALEVHIAATKPEIKKALEQLFNVKVKKVRTEINKYSTGSTVRIRRGAIAKKRRDKRAYITLAEGYSLQLFEQAAIGQGQAPVVTKEKTTD